MSERVIEWVTKTDFGKFPKGTEHVKIENPYGVGYEGTIHAYRFPDGREGRHIDY
jgi:hypothetical protein